MAFDFSLFLMFLFSEVKLKTTTGNRKKMKMNDRIRVVNRQESGEEVFNLREKITDTIRVTRHPISRKNPV